ncbi:MAG: hypothetical protein KGH64_03650, partial [Candidatus Micrarchaeota archaeon]|nr:hypothetical protein [Candidatus Micrarchaeota archaeon]
MAAFRNQPQLRKLAQSKINPSLQRPREVVKDKLALKASRRAPEQSNVVQIKSVRRKEENKKLLEDASLVGGVVGPALGFGTTLYVVGLQKHFSWTAMKISDIFGNHPGSNLLGYGVGVSGALSMGYCYGLYKSLPKASFKLGPIKGNWNMLGTAAMAQSMASLSVTAISGMINSRGLVHYVSSGTYYYGVPVALSLFGAGMLRKKEDLVGGITLASAGAALSAGIYGILAKSPIPAEYEFGISLIAGGWAMATASYLTAK